MVDFIIKLFFMAVAFVVAAIAAFPLTDDHHEVGGVRFVARWLVLLLVIGASLKILWPELPLGADAWP
jgi:hypothetical protein